MSAAARISEVGPGAWKDEPAKPIPLLKAARADIIAHFTPPERKASPVRWAWMTVRVLLVSSGLHVSILYRLAYSARVRFGTVGRIAGVLLFWCIKRIYGCAISPAARLHGGLIFPHPQGIVIGAGSVVGPRAWIFQNVTLGGAPARAGMPVVGADARIYAGAVLAGAVRVGDNVVIGANAVVTNDVESRSLVRQAEPLICALPDRLLVEPEDFY